MKQDVNYILHHKNVNLKMIEDNYLSSTHIALYNALFLIWNECSFDTELSINRNDVMKLSKIGSANTYTKALKELHELGYINYKPSHNPLIGSKINLYRFDNSTDNSTDKSSVKSSSKGTDNSTDTLYKQLNNETNKQLNNEMPTADYSKNYLEKKLSDLKDEDVPNHEHLKITLAYQQLFIANLNEANASTIKCRGAKGKWIEPIRLLIEKDGYNIDDLKQVYKFLQKNAFWKSNIISTEKLRKQFEKLKLQAHAENKPNNAKGATGDELRAIIEAHFRD